MIAEYCNGHLFKKKFIGPIVDSYNCQSAEKVTELKKKKIKLGIIWATLLHHVFCQILAYLLPLISKGTISSSSAEYEVAEREPASPITYLPIAISSKTS